MEASESAFAPSVRPSAQAWSSRWNVLSGRASRLHVAPVQERAAVLAVEGEAVRGQVEQELGKVFDADVVREWVQCFVQPREERLREARDLLDKAEFH